MSDLFYVGAVLNAPAQLVIMMIKGPEYMLHSADPDMMKAINFVFYMGFIAIVQWYYIVLRKKIAKSNIKAFILLPVSETV